MRRLKNGSSERPDHALFRDDRIKRLIVRLIRNHRDCLRGKTDPNFQCRGMLGQSAIIMARAIADPVTAAVERRQGHNEPVR